MDFRYSPEEETFRAELRAWLAEHLPRHFAPGELDEEQDPDARFEKLLAWHRAMHAGKWVGIHWPREYGGRGATLLQQLVYAEEMGRANAPAPINPIGIMMVGPTLMQWGTEAQKRRFIPTMLSAEEIWCQGYSEPNAGSDLAALQTRAVADGDDYVVNGQKVWTSLAHRAHWCILLCRTDPTARKHLGISYLLVDMRSPGITVRPLVQITGDAEFNEVFFEDVRVPKANLVGRENEGWQVAMTTLQFERVGLGAVYSFDRLIRELTTLARRRTLHGRPAIEDGYVRERLARLATEAAALRCTQYRQVTRRIRGEPPGPEASVAKLFGTELNLRIVELASELIGEAGLIDRRSGAGDETTKWLRRILAVRAFTIGGGTSEVQRNIIGERVLKLPRG
ncbi:MAG: acyl-CoA dehydrogenase [Deltaproteobacteria bacterium]|nr:MAG: acyl-CoA dehydrogenase [Deltaproteobacteria bacterium]